jgi:enoyl-CoA hydratase/carnithine racemase
MTIRTELQDGVLIVTIDNVERMNSVGPAATRDLGAAWARARDDDEIKVVVMTAAGDRAFCTGMDMSEAGDVFDDTVAPAVGPLENDLWKPVIVAVNGVCAGAGLHFVAEADIALAASHATFLDPHVTVGQVAAFEPILLSRRMPLGAVSRMCLLGRGERIDAEAAKALGLVSEVVDGPALLDRAMELAGKLKANSPAAMIGTKKALWRSLDLGLTEAMAEGWKLVVAHWDHPDSTEGPTAFMEKRPPAWG